jgi:ABC-type uncharacterized transport system substrate-binding protein
LLVALSFEVEAQQPKKVYRLGYLSLTDAASESARSEGIRLALRELGYIEGQNIAIEYRYTEGKVDRAPELAAELVRLKVDIIVTGGRIPVRAAKNVTKTIPIVMLGSGTDPVAEGLVESLARPGGNVTGLTPFRRTRREAAGAAQRSRSQTCPGRGSLRSRYSGQYTRVERGSPSRGADSGVDDSALGGTCGRLREGIRWAKQGAPGWTLRARGPLMAASGKRIADFAIKSRLPSVYVRRESVDAGGLMSYAADRVDSYRLVATYVDRILKGAKPADLPVEQPTKFELAINLKTAKQIGLTIPQSMLYRADKVIK